MHAMVPQALLDDGDQGKNGRVWRGVDMPGASRSRVIFAWTTRDTLTARSSIKEC